ncbi:hypothetical protein RB195_000258 [Necator americanus]|uniref:PP1-binding domain-containing protein n=1 Tax=Necator americanus TaxID=51031 RepID=A0ABR1D8Y5_NECAM
MLAFFFNLRSKSFLRSSSGPSYPYPRTHTTLMVVPSNRPVAPTEPPTTKKQSSRRRPPLNRSIPPIPESKSNESIMSQASRRSNNNDKTDDSQQSDCVVIENRTVIQQLHRNQKIPRPPTSKRPSDAKGGQKSHRSSETTPRSPLMTVARTVKNKFTKLTRMGRHEQHDVSMKGSQSFSGIRQPKASIPKRIDQNANRVIKSSSMDVATTSQEASAAPSTSRHMVVIPQNPTRLEDFSEETSLAEQVLQKENTDPEKAEDANFQLSAPEDRRRFPETTQAVSMSLDADVLVVTKELDSTSSASQRTETKRIIEVEEKTLERIEKVPESEKEQTTHEISNSNDLYCSSPPLNTSECSGSHGFADEGTCEVKEEPATVDVPPFTQGNLKTPHLPRKHHTFLLGEKIPDTSSDLKAENVQDEVKRVLEVEEVPVEETSPTPRYVMTVKTPEPMRKHLAFFVDESDPQTAVGAKSPKKKKKIVKQRSMPECTRTGVSPERYIMKIKTPEALRRHHTFTITERPRSPDVPYIEEGEITEPIATVGPTAEKLKRSRSESAKRSGRMVDENSKLEKFTITVKTPFTMRKFKTFMVEEKPKSFELPQSKSVEALAHAKVSFAVDPEEIVEKTPTQAAAEPVSATPHVKKKQIQSGSDEEDVKEMEEVDNERNEKFVLTTSTPLTMRKFQTFMIEDKNVADQPTKSHTICNIDAIASLEKEAEVNEPLKTSDMYMLTTMTPLPQRKERPNESHLERIAREKSRSTSRSPDKACLFIMGTRNSRTYHQPFEKEFVVEREVENVKCAVVQPQRISTSMDSPSRERSHSDNAEPIERKASCSPGEMTSPEEEIPMDTHLTPTEEHDEDALIIRPIRRPPDVASPITEEPELSVSLDVCESSKETAKKEESGPKEKDFEPPIFRPPSPPKEVYKPITSSKSTSPLKRRKESCEKQISTVRILEAKSKPISSMKSRSEERKEKKAEEKEKERTKQREKREREERERDRTTDRERLSKSPKMPITTSILRSLRSAGKMLAPSFFRKGESKIPKSSKTASSPPVMTVTKQRMSLPFRNGRRAPLAEFESLVVEDSPAVENNPISFEKWSASPRGKRRHSAHVNGFTEPIVEESDGNGNVGVSIVSRVECVMSPALPRQEPDRGLIDDEILDQPMLVGDTFSHSDSIDGLSAIRRMEFEAEKATLISIDRSLIEDSETM